MKENEYIINRIKYVFKNELYINKESNIIFRSLY